MPKQQRFIPLSEPDIGAQELKNVTAAVKSGWVSSLGYFVEKFENDFARFVRRRYGVSTSNGTHALHLALMALGVKNGDEVIVPALTFAAVANAVLYAGAKPIHADVQKDTLNIDPEDVKRRITKKTKALVIVHSYGHPADVAALLAIAKKHKLYVIEDAAEAHGAYYKNKPCGSFGDVSCFSFYGNKTITTGEGGMCVTNDRALDKRMRYLRDHAMPAKKKYWHDEVGNNYRMTNMQAALGCAQLAKLNRFVEAKRQNAARYQKELANVDWIHPISEKSYAKNSYWMFVVLVDKDFKYTRDEIIQKLEKKGIQSRVIFYPLGDMPPYKTPKKQAPAARDVAYRGINLPSSTKLTKEDIAYVCNTLKEL